MVKILREADPSPVSEQLHNVIPPPAICTVHAVLDRNWSTTRGGAATKPRAPSCRF